MTSEVPALLELVGLTVGFTSLTIAIYLRMISRKYCPPKYTLLYFSFGAAVLMINSLGVFSPLGIPVLEILGYGIILVLEIAIAVKINGELDYPDAGVELEDWVYF